MDHAARKESLRKELKTSRFALSPEEVNSKSARIWERLRETFELGDYKRIHCFQSMEKFREVNTQPLLNWVEKELPQSRIVVPVMVPGSNALRHIEWKKEIRMEPNRFGVPEPVVEQVAVEVRDIDLVIIPLLGFDEEGNRLGYGKGYYDRFLSQLRPGVPKVGVAFELSHCASVPAEEHDIPLDCVISEEKVYKFVTTISDEIRKE